MKRDGGVSGWRAKATSRRSPILSAKREQVVETFATLPARALNINAPSRSTLKATPKASTTGNSCPLTLARLVACGKYIITPFEPLFRISQRFFRTRTRAPPPPTITRKNARDTIISRPPSRTPTVCLLPTVLELAVVNSTVVNSRNVICYLSYLPTSNPISSLLQRPPSPTHSTRHPQYQYGSW